MSWVTSNLISDCSDSCISIAEFHTFGGKIKSREDDGSFLFPSERRLLLEAESEMLVMHS